MLFGTVIFSYFYNINIYESLPSRCGCWLTEQSFKKKFQPNRLPMTILLEATELENKLGSVTVSERYQ